MSAQWASLFFEILRTPGASLVPSQSLDRPVAGDILFAIAAVQLPLGVCGHFCLKFLALIAKNLIDPENNHLHHDFHRLNRSAGAGNRQDQCLIGSNARGDLKRLSSRKTDVKHDNNKNLSLLNKGLKGRDEKEMIDLIIAGVSENRITGATVQDRKAVLQSFMSFAQKYVLFKNLGFYSRLVRRYNSKPQKGNETAHKKNNDAETRRNNDTIDDLVTSGGCAWVQGFVEPGSNAAARATPRPQSEKPWANCGPRAR